MSETSTINFPFSSVLNLRLLIDYWEKAIQDAKVPSFAKGMLDYLHDAPELREPITDPAVLEKHRTFVDFLMTAVVPPASHNTELATAIYPFDFKTFYSTPAFERTISMEDFVKGSMNVPGNRMAVGRIIKACLMILEKFHDTSLKFDKPVLMSFKDEKTGLDKVYRVEMNSRFCDIVARVKPKPIDKKVIKFLMEKIYDIDLWMQYIRPDDYEFHGFIVIRLVDVTEQEMLSSLKYDLLERNAVVKEESFARIQHKLRSLFGIPEIRLGIAYFDPNNNLVLNGSSSCWKSLADRPIPDDDLCGDYAGSVYERSWTEKRYITIENLQEYPFRSAMETSLLANGVNNLLLAPLIEENETIGMLELATPTPGQLNSFSAHKVEQILPMFTTAVKRVKEEMNTEVRAIIQEECTAIHPTVQWRFFEAGVTLMNKRRKGEKAAMEEIKFNDVYPLYGMADVRNSSIERNMAIQQDLQQNLSLAKELLHNINARRKLPVVAEVIYKTEEQYAKISRGLASGDESDVLEFLKTEINPLLEHFEGTDLQEMIDHYRSHLDPVFGVVYKRRKDFEESLALINATIANHLDEAEESAQEMFPHYFEKYKTDGVEYTLYLGSSLVKDRTFDNFYLRNFRLWQLLTMCEIDRKIQSLRPILKTDLEITQLILIHDQAISLRFRPDEKQFDVDGAYDIRYEIVKKRIDKAYIKNTGERLTQPGKIAIVYNQAKVEDEYRRFFHYLAAKKLVTGEIEMLDLEELPGASGLRALRIQVARSPKPTLTLEKDHLLRDIEEGLRVH